MKILVTGGSGNLGGTIISLGSEHEFMSVGRNEWHRLDSMKYQSVDAVIHCAYDLKHQLSEYPDLIMEANILATTKVLKFVKKHKIPKLFFISSCAVYGRSSNTSEDSLTFPESINGIVKLLNERMILDFCKNTPVKVTILRVFNLYGGDDHFSVVNHLIDSIKNKKEFILNNDGVSRRDFVHVTDVANIILKLLQVDSSFGILNVGTGHSISIKELLQFVEARKSVKIKESNNQEIEYSRANITRLKSLIPYNFIDIFDYIDTELKKLPDNAGQ